MRLIFLFLLWNVQLAVLLQKCCDEGSFLVRNNSRYFCADDAERRVQINTFEDGFLAKNSSGADGFCFDGADQITRYKVRNQTVVEERPISVNFYPKCCPLNHYYSSKMHGCVFKNNLDRSFIKQNFVKVGLPHCRVLVDYHLQSEKHYYRIELDTLHIDAEDIKYHSNNYCVDLNEDNRLMARGCHEDLDVCEETKCLHKCCPDGQSFVNGQNCKNTYSQGMNLSFSERIRNATGKKMVENVPNYSNFERWANSFTLFSYPRAHRCQKNSGSDSNYSFCRRYWSFFSVIFENNFF